MLIGGIVLLVLALAGGGAWFFLGKKAAADEDVEEVVHAAPSGPPTFLPLDNMVVNLADPGGEKVAQIGITLELADAHATDKVKMYLPSIRSGILLLISQRTAEELLLIEGKEKLAADILQEASRPFAVAATGSATAKSKKDVVKAKKKNVDKHATDENPVRGVHFSSFIVQ
jgi:flagellar FliL protein